MAETSRLLFPSLHFCMTEASRIKRDAALAIVRGRSRSCQKVQARLADINLNSEYHRLTALHFYAASSEAIYAAIAIVRSLSRSCAEVQAALAGRAVQ